MKSLDERFWEKVDFCEHGLQCSECCWPWLAARYKDGYGMFRVNSYTPMRAAHRVAFCLVNEIEILELETVEFICHICHQKWCVNPNHLWLGDSYESSIYSVQKCRHTNQKISPVELREIRYFISIGIPQTEIAQAYGVSDTCISDINVGRSWSHLPTHQ